MRPTERMSVKPTTQHQSENMMKTIIIALLLSTSIANAGSVATVKDADAVSMCNAVRVDAIKFFQNLKNGQTLKQQMAQQKAIADQDKKNGKGLMYIYTKVLNSLYNNTDVASFPTPADFGDAVFDTCHNRAVNGTL
jgi:hypothetical protein